ncbi:Protein CBG21763 [Caenorhabditis briggsae]|uniref:Protein CBG21763 n=1 Tax=Caenorhabditis briggsae TaxID=6238 RepID=A8Y0J5_CAEBR|nr:Protein CBG21763 [Caenorhabditis briggsae]CAP38413.2 Protein CBG21763 [Caenorhabditis briggsae]
MFVKASIAVVLLLAATAHAGFLDDVQGVSSDVGNFFSTQFQNAKDLFSNNQDELTKNVERVKELLTGLKEKVKGLEPLANDAQKETLKKVDEFLAKVTEFQTEVKAEGAEKFEENKSKWNQMVTDIFDKGGLNSVMKLVGLQNSAPVSSFVSAALAPVFYMIFVH